MATGQLLFTSMGPGCCFDVHSVANPQKLAFWLQHACDAYAVDASGRVAATFEPDSTPEAIQPFFSRPSGIAIGSLSEVRWAIEDRRHMIQAAKAYQLRSDRAVEGIVAARLPAGELAISSEQKAFQVGVSSKATECSSQHGLAQSILRIGLSCFCWRYRLLHALLCRADRPEEPPPAAPVQD